MFKVNNKDSRTSHVDFEEVFVHVDFEQLFVCLNLVCYAQYEVAFSAYKKKQFYVQKNSAVKESKMFFLKMS